MMPTAKGFTLLELLAALVILSSIAAAGATVLRDGTRIGRDAVLRQQATEILKAWSIENHNGELKSPWEHLDSNGARWVVSITELVSHVQAVSKDDSDEAVELQAHWIRVDVRRQMRLRSDTVMTVYTLAQDDTDQGDSSP